MVRINKKNQKAKDHIIATITSYGYSEDRYGNYKKTSETGTYRYKFSATSYRREKLIDTKPTSWMRISGGYYKDVKIA